MKVRGKVWMRARVRVWAWVRARVRMLDEGDNEGDDVW